MNKPKRSEDKYWGGTRNFNELQFISDLEDYIIYLEQQIEAINTSRVKIESEQLKALLLKVINEFDEGELSWETRDEIESKIKSQ